LEAIFFGQDAKKEFRTELVKAVSKVIIGRAEQLKELINGDAGTNILNE